MSRKNKRALGYFDQQKLDYMDGNRVGKISSTRQILINVLVYQGKESGKNYKPSKVLLKKINRDIDHNLMHKLIFVLLKDKMPIDFLEENYDKLFLLPNYSGDESAEGRFDPLPLQVKEIFVNEGLANGQEK